jgi:ABC-type Fe3+-siderophore transport system permease subunit
MTSRTLLTITAVVAVLYGLAFVLIPDSINALYGVPSAPHTALYTRFFGSALLGFGVINWFAKDFRSWDAIRGVLIGIAVTTAIGGLIALFAVVTGLSNALTWTSVLVYALLLAGSVYWLSQGEKNAGVSATLAR